MQKGSGEAMLVKFLNPFEDEQNLFMGASKQVQCKNVQSNKFNSLQYSIIIPYTNNIFTYTNILPDYWYDYCLLEESPAHVRYSLVHYRISSPCFYLYSLMMVFRALLE